VDAVPAANYSDLCAYQDGDRYGLFVGDVTVDGRDFKNVILEYDTNVKCWQGHCTAGSFRVFANAEKSTGAFYIAGGGTNYCYEMFTGNNDDGSPIAYERHTRKVDFDGLYTVK
jgi:hypothetical protein